jgi:AcrR family transcriptional regulator
MSESIPIGHVEEASSITRQVRRDAAENRELILLTAEKLFAERGVAETNMADIAQAAGVGKGTLYRRFANKGELCLAIMDTQMLEFQETSLERMRQMTVAQVPKMEQLDQFLDTLVHFIDAHIPLLCEVQQLGLLEDIPGQQRPHFWQHMTISGLLQGAIAAGELPSGLDVTYISDAILATLKADLFRFQRQGRDFSLERISAGLRSLVAGLRS